MIEKPRNPLVIIRHYIEEYQTSLRARKQPDIFVLLTKLKLLETLESDMETEYFPLGEKTTLEDLRCGAVFATEDGVFATKTEYRYSNEPGAQCMCILLSSGEFAHFEGKNKTIVYEVIMPNTERGEQA